MVLFLRRDVPFFGHLIALEHLQRPHLFDFHLTYVLIGKCEQPIFFVYFIKVLPKLHVDRLDHLVLSWVVCGLLIRLLEQFSDLSFKLLRTG